MQPQSMQSNPLVGTLEKMIRQKDRWAGVAQAWRRRSLMSSTENPETYKIKAEILTYCCDDLQYMVDQLARRVSAEDREEAYKIAREKAEGQITQAEWSDLT